MAAGMYAIRLDPSGTPLTITSDPYFLTSLDAPEPPLRPIYVSAFGTDGATRVGSDYDNRTITIGLRVIGSSADDLENQVQTLQSAITKLHREGGVMELTTPNNTVVNATVLDANITVPLTKRYALRFAAEPTITLTCSPLFYGTENTPVDNTETTLPHIVFTTASVAGDVPALGRIVASENQGQSQLWGMWGIRSKNYSASADAALFYEAEGRTLQGAGATTATSATVYSGSSYVIAGSLSTEYVSILSTQATGGGNHLAHVGRYRVWARMQTASANTGTVTTALQWGIGDFRSPTTNTEVQLTTTNGYAAAAWNLVNLGTVNIPAVLTGTQRWEGRIVAKSTVSNDDILVDCFWLMPADEGYGEVAATVAGDISSTATPTARDDFSSGTYGAALTGSTPVTGGVWTAPTVGTGLSATDFTVTGGVAQRTAVSDAATDVRYGRWVYPAGTSAMTATLAQVDMSRLSGVTVLQGLVLRATDKNNFLVVGFYGSGNVYVYKVIAGVATLIKTSSAPLGLYFRLRAKVLADGTLSVYAASAGSLANLGTPTLLFTISDSTLATGGTLASGFCGIYDWQTSATAQTRQYDNFSVSTTVADAACFASRQMQVRYDGVIRQDSAGSYYQPVGTYKGDYLLVPPSGRESRTTQTIVKLSRGVPGSGSDSAIDDLGAKLYITPRYLTLPT